VIDRALGRTRLPLTRLATTVVVVLVASVAIVPFLYVLSSSLKSGTAIFAYPPEWIPRPFYLGNFRTLLEGDFPVWALRTVAVAGTIALLKVWFDSMAAYAFAKLRFPGRQGLFVGMFLTIMVPPVALIVPLFFIVRDLGGLNSYWALILPPMANPIGIFMLRGFIQSLPDEMLQAAKVDNAGQWATYRLIVLPVIKPGLVIVGLYTFMLQYTNFIWPLVIAPEKPMLTTGLASLKPLTDPNWGQISAAAMLTMVPITLVFLLLQRSFVSASVASATKG
jgi:multiple sugar transport system permease protein